MRRTERTHYTHLFIIYLFDIIYVKDLAPAVLAPAVQAQRRLEQEEELSCIISDS